MKKFLFICLLILGLSAQSQVFVQRQEAINIACRFLQYDNALRGNPDGNVQLSYIIRNDDTLMYVVDVLDKSVLIPRTKSCPAIMGYWQRENTNINDTSYLIHHVLGKYINGYCDYIENSIRTRNSNIAPAWNRSIDALQNRNNVVIGPLLSSNWGQSISNDSGENVDSNAYNYYVDTVSENGKVCMAGCVAVAIGQIMNYWKYPIYRSNRSADHQFDWCNMADKLTTTSPNYISERNAVARLLRDCGEAVRMNYCFSGVASFAFPHMALRAFVDTFDYSEDA